MFTPAVHRIVWKEFRAQRAIWFGIAFELVLLQIWQGMFPQRFQVNLFSIACVLTGVLAMTSSALLFAGESEAQTDGFLRQLPFRSRDVLLGKLGFCLAAVTSFLGFSLLTAMLVNALTSGGSLQSREFDGMMVYANMIGGLWAWGIFYSLITRKVMWTLVGAGLTEIFVNVVLYGTKGFWQPDSTVSVIYRGLVVVVFFVDAWLLSRWYAGVDVFQGVPKSMANLEADELTLVSPRPLPWSRSWKVASRAGIAFGVIWYILLFASASENRGIDSLYLPVIALGCLVGAVIGAIVVIGLRTFRLISPGHSPSMSELRAVSHAFRFSFVLKQAFRLLSLFGVCILALGLGIVVGFCSVLLLIVGFVEWPPGYELLFVVSVSVTSTLVGGLVLWGVGRLLDSSSKKHSPRLSIRALQFAQSTFQSINRSWGSLLWVETRRAVPFLIGGAVILGMTGAGFFWFSREVGAGLSFWGLLMTSYICGLMTILPDRSKGTLSLLIERGVPAWRILTAKLVVWGMTLVIMAVIPLVLCYPLWSSMWSRINDDLTNSVSVESQLGQTPWMVSPATQLFLGINAGLFAIGALSAAWIRRPILAVIGGFVGVILWLIWCIALVENKSLFVMAYCWPIVMCIIGCFASGTTTLVEQVNWKSKVRRVAWGMLIVGGALYWLRNFRIHEIPNLEFGETRKLLVERHAKNPPPVPKRIVIHGSAGREDLSYVSLTWKSLASSEASIHHLHLNLITCDLNASLVSLVTGLRTNNENARNAQTESELIEAVKVRRILLSAVRRWANHSRQTAELLEEGDLRFSEVTLPGQFLGADLLAHQYVAAMQAIETGPSPTGGNLGNPSSRENPLIRSLLRLSGEQERVRRLVDMQFQYLAYFPMSAESTASPSDNQLQLSIERWRQNTNLSLHALGVQLPAMNLFLTVLNEMKLIDVSTQATALVLQLQLWRAKHGQFPATMIETLHDDQKTIPELFAYFPEGLNRPLRSHAMRVTPMRQPVVYHRGVIPIHGIELIVPSEESRAFYRARSWLLDESYVPWSTSNYFQQSSKDQQATQTQILAEAEGPVNPNEIRFVILGRSQDEDRLCLPPEQQTSMSFEKLQEAIDRGSSGQTNSEKQGAMSPSAEPAPTVPPTPEIPPAPPESQAAESVPE